MSKDPHSESKSHPVLAVLAAVGTGDSELLEDGSEIRKRERNAC